MTEIKSGRKASDVRLFIAMPALDGKMHCSTTGAMWDAGINMIAAGLPHTPYINYAMQDSNLPFARNRTLAEFMETDATDLIFIDSDMSWDVESWMRLILHPVEFVGAAYRKKIQLPNGELGMGWAVDFLPPDENGNVNGSDPETGLLEVKRLAAGFLRITRSAVQKMLNEVDVPVYPYQNPVTGKTLTIHRLFANEWNGHRVGFQNWVGEDVGEDYTFCDRWRSIGGNVWCDPELLIGHHGMAVFKGRLGDYIRGIAAAQAQSFAMSSAAPTLALSANPLVLTRDEGDPLADYKAAVAHAEFLLGKDDGDAA